MSFTTKRLLLAAKEAVYAITIVRMDCQYCYFRTETCFDIGRALHSDIVVFCGNTYYKFWPSPFVAPLPQILESPIFGYLLRTASFEAVVTKDDLVHDFPSWVFGAVYCGIDPPGVSERSRYAYFCSLFIHLVNNSCLYLFRPRRRWACILSIESSAAYAYLYLLLGYLPEEANTVALAIRYLELACIERIYYASRTLAEGAFALFYSYLHVDFAESELEYLFTAIIAFWQDFRANNHGIDPNVMPQPIDKYKLLESVSGTKMLYACKPYAALHDYELSVASNQRVYACNGDLYGWLLCETDLGHYGWLPESVLVYY